MHLYKIEGGLQLVKPNMDHTSDKKYRCFPIVPKLAAHHLKIPFLNPPRPITLLGGLTSFGGAGNNYSLHVCISKSQGSSEKKTILSHTKLCCLAVWVLRTIEYELTNCRQLQK